MCGACVSRDLDCVHMSKLHTPQKIELLCCAVWLIYVGSMGIGRPTKFTDELAATICVRVAEGEPTRAIAKDLGLSLSSLFKWLDENPSFSERYARAKEVAMEAMADEMLTIADDSRRDSKLIVGHDGEAIEVPDHDHIQRARLRVDTRKWLMSKLAPKKYGDRIQQDLTNSDGSLVGLSLAQLKQRAKSILSDADE